MIKNLKKLKQFNTLIEKNIEIGLFFEKIL